MSLTDEQLKNIGWEGSQIGAFREGEFDAENHLPQNPPTSRIPDPERPGVHKENPDHEAYISGYMSGESKGSLFIYPTSTEVMGSPESEEEMLTAEEKFNRARRREGAPPRKRTHGG